jgi:hypothetical protein
MWRIQVGFDLSQLKSLQRRTSGNSTDSDKADTEVIVVVVVATMIIPHLKT